MRRNARNIVAFASIRALRTGGPNTFGGTSTGTASIAFTTRGITIKGARGMNMRAGITN